MNPKHDKVELGDVVVVLMRETRKKLAGEVIARNKNEIRIEVSDKYGETDTHDLKIGEDSTILTNLGDNPLSGTVYSCQIRKIHSRVSHNFWGNITFFRDMDDEEKDALKYAMKKTYGTLKQLGLEKTIQLDNLLIQDAKGKYAGWYKQDRQGNHICYQPKEINKSTSLFLMQHEMAHAIWFQSMRPSAQAKWVHLYNEYINVEKYPEDALAEVMEVVIAQPRRLEEYYDLVSEIDYGTEWLGNLEDALRAIHLFDKDDLDLYLWSITPQQRQRALERAAMNVTHLTGEHDSFPVSDYAGKNTKEFFAESYCHALCMPNNVPDEVFDLLSKTVPGIKALL